MRFFVVLAAFLAASGAFAQQAGHPVLKGQTIQLTTLSGEVISGAFSRTEPDGIILRTDSGIQRVPFSALPDEIKRAYGYSPEAEAQFQQQKRQQQVSVVEKARQQTEQAMQQLKELEHQKDIEAFKQTGLKVTLKVIQVTRDGCLCSRYASVEKTIAVTEKDPEDLLKVKVSTVSKQVSEPVEFSNDIFVYGIGRGLADGQRWQGMIWKCGTYSFTSVIGAQRTLQAFSADPEQAWIYASKQGG